MRVWDRVLGDERDERLARPPAPALGTWRLPLRLELGEDPELREDGDAGGEEPDRC